MNITYWLILISIIACMIALYFDLRKVKSTELSLVSNNQFHKFFEELMEYENNTFGFSKPKPVYRVLSDKEIQSTEKRFLNNIKESKKYKVNYEVEKINSYPTFNLYKNYLKKNKKPELKLIEFKPSKTIFKMIKEGNYVEVN